MRKTNIERVEDFMNYQALGQVFVIDAITKLATQIVDNQAKLLASWPKDHIIDPIAWIMTAQAWLKTVEKGGGK